MREAMAEIATWIFFPSFVLTLIAGLLAIAANRTYHDAGWAWVKLQPGFWSSRVAYMRWARYRRKLGQAPARLRATRTQPRSQGRLEPNKARSGCSLRSRQSTSCSVSGGRASADRRHQKTGIERGI